MSDRPQGEGWWLASDGNWYPPESRQPAEPPPAAPEPPSPGPVGPPGEGWWLASDGNWYPPDSRSSASAAPPPAAPTSPGEGWWLASDGQWYPPESRPLAAGDGLVVGEVRLPARKLSSGTTTAVRILFYVVAALSLGTAAATVNEIAKFDAFIDGSPLGALREAEDLSRGFIGFWGLAGLAAGILLIVWLNQAYKAIEPRGASGRRWSSGWAVGGWFIPFANLVIPKLIVDEVDKVSSPQAEPVPVESRWTSVPPIPVSLWWWLFFVAGSILLTVGSGISGGEINSLALDPDNYRTGLWLSVVAFGSYTVAGMLGATVVKTIGDRLQ